MVFGGLKPQVENHRILLSTAGPNSHVTGAGTTGPQDAVSLWFFSLQEAGTLRRQQWVAATAMQPSLLLLLLHARVEIALSAQKCASWANLPTLYAISGQFRIIWLMWMIRFVPPPHHHQKNTLLGIFPRETLVGLSGLGFRSLLVKTQKIKTRPVLR